MEDNIEAPRINNPEKKPLVVGNLKFMPFFDYTLTEQDIEKAQCDLGETEENVKINLLKLKEMLERDNINYCTDDDYLLRYIRLRKHNCKKAYKSINNFYSNRKNHPEIFSIRFDLIFMLKKYYFTPLPYMDKDRNPIFVLKFENLSFEEISMAEFLSLAFICWNLWSMNPHAQINGVKFMLDFKGFTRSHAATLLRNFRFILPLFQDLYPWRVANLILFNVSSLGSMVIKVACRFLRMKMFEKVTIIKSDVKELHEHISPEVLTKEYDGNQETVDFDPAQHVLDNIDYLKYEYSFGQARRPSQIAHRDRDITGATELTEQ